MPLLKQGPEIYPQGLFDLSDDTFPWLVAHTRSRQEKALARHLASVRIPFYLPQTERRVRRSERSFVSYLPLFPGYVFLRARGIDRAAIFRDQLVARLLEVRDQALLNRELRELRALQLNGAVLVPYRGVAPGDLVSIMEGPFRGYTGRVLREQSRLRLIVSISMLNHNVAVEFDRACLARERRSSPAAGTRVAVA